MLKFLSRWPVLAVFALATGLIFYSFEWVIEGAGAPLLDMIRNGPDAERHLSAMTEAQRARHLFGTLVNDSLYPLAYGGLLAGLAYRFGASRSSLLVIPAVATVVVDFAENGIQALALAGGPNLLAAKTVITPLKFGLFFLAAFIALCLILLALGRKLLGGRSTA